MKKIITVITSLILILSVLSACSPETPSAAVSVVQSPSPSQVQTPTPKPSQTVHKTPEPSKQQATQTPSPTAKTSAEVTEAKRGLLVFMMAYPSFIQKIEVDKSGFVYVVMKSGTRIIYDDKKKKTFDQAMANGDLEDSLEILYPLTGYTKLPDGNTDPGRIRPYALLNDIYGKGEKGIRANLVTAKLGDKSSAFNKQNGASEALEAVFKELNALCAKDADINTSVYPLNGTFNYRYISGTELYSMHSYALAIDLHAKLNPSFRSITKAQGQKRIDSFPDKIVKVFEDHGFIWGGKWAHFDIMHFEYRPEIILKAKYDNEVKSGEPWYKGFPDDTQTKGFEKIIDKALD